MRTTIDLQTLLGSGSAWSIPPAVLALLKLIHPWVYTLSCGVGWHNGIGDCYADDRNEAAIGLLSVLIAVGYGVITLRTRLSANPTPPAGTGPAIIAAGQIPVTVDRQGTDGLQSAKAMPGTVAEPQPITPP